MINTRVTITVVLLLLKVWGLISISWIWVFSPIWLGLICLFYFILMTEFLNKKG